MSGMAARGSRTAGSGLRRPAAAGQPGRHPPPGAAAHGGLQGAGAWHDMEMSLFFEDLICEF